MDEGALGVEPVSMKRLSAEALEGGFLYWEPWDMIGRLWGRASLFMEAQLGNLEWGRLPGTLRVG
jgi:hypothetical protein